MGKVGTKPSKKAKPKLAEKEQSERFIETARDLRAEGALDEFVRVFKKIVPPKDTGR
jgi:hypothetical protein